MGPSTALAASGLTRGADGMWVEDAGVVGAVVTAHGTFVGWLDLAWDGAAVARRLRAVEHVTDGACAAAVQRARRERERSLRTCELCAAGGLPGHLH
jgi:hypothetical protein